MTRRTTAAILAAYTAVVLAITMTPQRPGPGFLTDLVGGVLDALYALGLPLWIDYGVVEFTANIGMFVPLGALAAALVPRRAWWTLLVMGTAFSTLIELTQMAIPGRFPDVRDVIANSAGFLIGAAITVATRARKRTA